MCLQNYVLDGIKTKLIWYGQTQRTADNRWRKNVLERMPRGRGKTKKWVNGRSAGCSGIERSGRTVDGQTRIAIENRMTSSTLRKRYIHTYMYTRTYTHKYMHTYTRTHAHTFVAGWVD